MSTTIRPDTGPTSTKAGARQARVPSRLRSGPRRSVPHLAVGVLLVVACTTAFTVAASRLDERTPVLALAEPVTVGQVLATSDLREVRIAARTEVGVIPSSQASQVVGSTMAVSLPAGTLLGPAMLGDAAVPGPGEAVVAVAVAPGQFPPEVYPGAQVIVVPQPSNSSDGDPESAGGPGSGWAAIVLGVHPTTTDATTVLSLQLDDDAAREIATAGPVRVVMTAVGGG